MRARTPWPWLLLATLAVLLAAAPAQAHSITAPKPVSKMTLAEKEKHQLRALQHARGAVRYLERHLAAKRARAASARRGPAYQLRWHRAQLRWVQRELAETRAAIARHQRLQHWAVPTGSDMGAWLCIHRGEGAWDSNTGNGYYGGLQMDLSFQRTYGPEFMARWGTADNWPVWAQITAARRARDSGRGYYPWPTTARRCGLI